MRTLRVLLDGLNTDIPAMDAPPTAWTAAEGVTFRQGVAERAAGARQIYADPSETVYHLRNNYFDGTGYWIYGADAALYCQDSSGTETDLTGSTAPSGATDPNQWTWDFILFRSK